MSYALRPNIYGAMLVFVFFLSNKACADICEPHGKNKFQYITP